MLKIFVHSCIFIQSFKKPPTQEALELMDLILKNYKEGRINPYINLVVENEVIYVLTFKKKSKFDLKSLFRFITAFQFLEITFEIRNLYKSFIENYHLKPNDALILATCKHYGIKYLISIDSDFPEPCEKEGIVLIDSPEKLKEILKTQ